MSHTSMAATTPAASGLTGSVTASAASSLQQRSDSHTDAVRVWQLGTSWVAHWLPMAGALRTLTVTSDTGCLWNQYLPQT